MPSSPQGTNLDRKTLPMVLPQTMWYALNISQVGIELTPGQCGLQGDMAACEVETSGPHRLLVGGLARAAGSPGQLFILDLATGQATGQVQPFVPCIPFQAQGRMGSLCP